MAVSIGTVCRACRQRAGLRQIDIAELAGVSHTTISHFETGDWWARRTDEIVVAYATACAVDAETLWRLALEHASGP